MDLLLLYIFLCIIVGAWAGGLGRNGFGWFVLTLIISPLFAAIALLIVGRPANSAINRVVVESPDYNGDDYVDCPECAEPVRHAARRCRHCGAALTPTIPDQTQSKKVPMSDMTIRQVALVVIGLFFFYLLIRSP